MAIVVKGTLTCDACGASASADIVLVRGAYLPPKLPEGWVTLMDIVNGSLKPTDVCPSCAPPPELAVLRHEGGP